MARGYSSRSCVVLTTPERFNLFSSVLGDEVDARFDPETTRPLEGLLEAIALSGGETVVLDEAHFYNDRDLEEGLDRYLDGDTARWHPMRFIVVCSRRSADDPLLAHLAMYDGIYDLVFDAQGAEVSACLMRLLERRNRRSDIREIFSATKKQKERISAFRSL